MFLNFHLFREKFQKSFNTEKVSMKSITRIFHYIFDAMENLNSTTTFHLNFVIIIGSIIDVYTLYYFMMEIFPYLVQTDRPKDFSQLFEYRNIETFQYFFIQQVLKISIAHIGHKTTEALEISKALLGKYLNSLDFCNHVDRFTVYNALIQYQSRSLKYSNTFFMIDWSILMQVN